MARKKEYDVGRPVHSHTGGKAIAYASAWIDYYVLYGCDPDRKALYLEHVAPEGTFDKFDKIESELQDGEKLIDARNSANTFIKRYSIKEYVDAAKIKELASRSSLVKNDYITMYNAIAMDIANSPADRMKAMEKVTKMLGIEGASKIEQTGGFKLNMDWKKED